MSQLQEFRTGKDDFFADHPQSPLSVDQKQGFRGLDYFDENLDLLLDVEIDVFPEQTEVMLQTSIGLAQTYTRFGKFRFSVDGQDAELTLFSSDHGYFLPFVDSLAGQETYPSGRYLDLGVDQKTVAITFVSRKTGVKIKWFLNKNFNLEEIK